MRRILNLNSVSVLFVKIIFVLVIAIPAVLYGIARLLQWVNIETVFIYILIKKSLSGGALVSILFAFLIIAEQIQDRIIDIQDQKNRERRS